jgi:hypothetical protein
VQTSRKSSIRVRERAFTTLRRALDRDPENLEGIVALGFTED